jgi:hypothetical protein
VSRSSPRGRLEEKLTSAEEIKAAIDAAVIDALADLSLNAEGETYFDLLRQEAGFG